MINHKPREVFVRVLKRSMFIQLGFMCFVYGTSTNVHQLLVAHVVCALTLIMAVLIALLFAASADQKAQEDWLVAGRAAIHYPAAANFQEKVVSVEEERRRYRKPINEYV